MMVETILKEDLKEIKPVNNVLEMYHVLESAKENAEVGHVDYVKECLSEADDYAMKTGRSINKEFKSYVMRTALKKGIKRQLFYVERYKSNIELRDSCLNSVKEYEKELSNYPSLLRSTFRDKINRIAGKLGYAKISNNEPEKAGDANFQTLSYNKKTIKKVEDTRKKLTESKPYGLRWFERFRKPSETSIQEEKAIPTKDIIPRLRKMSSEIYESSPEMMLELSYKWAQDDAESGNVASTKANIENIKKYSRKLGAFAQDHELEHILSTSYKNGVDAALKKAKRHAQKGIFSKAKAELDEARFYASSINSSIPIEEAESILKTAYTKGLSKMLDRSERMAEKGKVKAAAKALKLSQECADYIRSDISQKREEILGTAYSNEIVRVFSKAKKKADFGMFDAVKRALKTIELDASHVGRSVKTQKKNYLLRTAAKNGVLRELEKAEISHDAGEEASAKRCLKKAGKLADEILNYQRSLKEMPLGSRMAYRLRYDNASDKYDIKTIKDQEKLKKKVEKTKNELLSSNILDLKV